MKADVKKLKEQFNVDPDVIFLNHGSFGATPKPVFDCYVRWQRELESQPVAFFGRRAGELLSNARTILATYLGTAKDNLVFVQNATFGINIIARSLNLSENDEVLATNHEYGAADRTWKYLSLERGFKYINQPIATPVTSQEDLIEELWQGVTENTRVIFISHISSPTALIFPVREICAKARHAGILTVVDGAHAPGQIPINLTYLDADFYVGNLHKWLCAPKGSAFLFARPNVQSLVEPVIVSWGWQSLHPSSSRFQDYIEYSGTRDISAFLAVPSAIQFQEENHWDNVRSMCHAMALEANNYLCRQMDQSPLSPQTADWVAQMVAVPLPPSGSADILQADLYSKFRIEVPVINWEGLNLLRISVQGYNFPEDIRILENAICTYYNF